MESSIQTSLIMPATFEVTIESVSEVHTLPGIWSAAELRQILNLAEFEDAARVEESELLDMVLMVLQDLGNQLAGELVLEAVFGDSMRPGVRQNLVDDLQQDEPWADYAVVAQQKGIFITVMLLQQAFPNRYDTAEAVRIRFTVRATSNSGTTEIAAARPGWLMRLLACGMSETDVLPRLYEKELASGRFADADGMIWQCEKILDNEGTGQGRNSCTFDLISSRLWLAPLSRGMSFQARLT